MFYSRLTFFDPFCSNDTKAIRKYSLFRAFSPMYLYVLKSFAVCFFDRDFGALCSCALLFANLFRVFLSCVIVCAQCTLDIRHKLFQFHNISMILLMYVLQKL